MKYIIEDIYGKYFNVEIGKYVVIARIISIEGEDKGLRKRLFFSEIEEAKKASIGTVVDID